MREATVGDLPQLLVLGRALHAESPTWSRLAFAPVRVLAHLHALIVAPTALVMVVEQDGQLVAGVMAQIEPHWSSHDTVAHELAFFVAPALRGSGIARRLVQALNGWAYDRGCVMLQAGTSTGIEPERCAQFYESLGFTRTTIGLELWYGR